MITISSQADCDRIFGAGEVDFDQLVQRASRPEPVTVFRFDEEKPPAGHHAPPRDDKEIEG